MNKILTSFNTFAFILLFLSFVFSVFSITTLKVDETQSIKVNFYELIEISEQPKRLSEARPKETIQQADLNKIEKNSEVKK